jgi:hypothetical protein
VPCTRAISEDEDIRAGRWWWSRVTKSADYIKISCYTKLESSNKLKHKNINLFVFQQRADKINMSNDSKKTNALESEAIYILEK